MQKFLIAISLIFILSACNPNPPTTISFENLPETGDSANGEMLFTQQACIACHLTGATGAPLLDEFPQRADSTVEGQSAREYTFYSIVEPGRYIVEGYGNAMPNNYDENMTAQDIADVIAYLLGG